ncbi:MAG TPA: ribonuclease III [Armatimonadota bacterium]|jgi:ribonuclease-3
MTPKRSRRARARSIVPVSYRDALPGYPVKASTLGQAFTHKSAEEEGPNNERLEFLGDAVLEIVITDYLYRHFPEFSEGELTKARVLAVSEPALADAAFKLGFGQRLRMSRGEEASGGRDRPSILSDVFEAIVAAIYLDLGLERAREFILKNLGHTLREMQDRDYKSLLQEFTQEKLRATPSYNIISEEGPAHDKRFTAQVIIEGQIRGQGDGRSKKEAEQSAAEAALEALTAWKQERK